jgi:hypothetical protein
VLDGTLVDGVVVGGLTEEVNGDDTYCPQPGRARTTYRCWAARSISATGAISLVTRTRPSAAWEGEGLDKSEPFVDSGLPYRVPTKG